MRQGAWISAALLLLLIPNIACGQSSMYMPVIDIYFYPETACANEQAQLFLSLENRSSTEEMVEVEVWFSLDGRHFGPYVNTFPVPAGQKLSRKIPFTLPYWALPVKFDVRVSAADSHGRSDDSSTFEVLDCFHRQEETRRTHYDMVAFFTGLIRSIGVRSHGSKW